MKLLDKQIVRELTGPFLFGVMAFSSVFFAGKYLLLLTQWLMDGMPVLAACQAMLFYLPGVVVYTLPMATLLAVLLGIGRLSSDSEMTALFAGGVSIHRIAAPIIIVGLLVSAASVGLNEYIAPRAEVRNKVLLDAMSKQESRSDQSFMLRDADSQSVIIIGGMDTSTGTLKNVTIIQYSEKQPLVTIYARGARWEGLHNRKNRFRWKLYDGYAVSTDGSGRTTFDEMQTRDIRNTPQQLEQFQKKPEEMSFAELSRFVKYLKVNPDRPPDKIRQLDVDRWNKLALPLSSLVFAMLAAPLAIRRQRSSSSVGLGLSILLIMLYWITWHYTSALAIQGNLEPPIGAFAADVAGIAAAVVLLKRSAK